jgi:diadenosine tetraphosphate (Ap4A) HIT family hydrolase
MSIIYENEVIYIQKEESHIPWLIIFTKKDYKEMSEVPHNIKLEIYELLDVIEKEMLAYYTPAKINIASFGNYMPQVHWHIMARFANDNYFPEPMWGVKQRETILSLPSFEKFSKKLTLTLSSKSLLNL